MDINVIILAIVWQYEIITLIKKIHFGKSIKKYLMRFDLRGKECFVKNFIFDYSLSK